MALTLWSEGSVEAVWGQRWQVFFSLPRTEPAAGKETGAAKVSKNLELARLTPASSSARVLGPVGLQGGPGGPGDLAPGIEGDWKGSVPMKSMSLSPHYSLGLCLSLDLQTFLAGVHSLPLPTCPQKFQAQ